MENKEMNFWDLCVAIGRAIGQACVWFGKILAHMLRLSWRYWWLAILFMALGVAAAMWFTRESNIKYKANAVALLNGPSIQQFEQSFAQLQSNRQVPKDAAIKYYLDSLKATHFKTFYVIDCQDDNTPDYIDFKKKVAPTDTVKVQMKDRLCLQFQIKTRNLEMLPDIETALLEWFNSNEAMQQSYAAYKQNLAYEVAFNHTQALKLDSLTSHYYFYQPSAMEPNAYVGTGVNFYGDRRIKLFLDEIYEQHEQMQRDDYRMQLATAPVVLENHFSLNPKPVYSRFKCVIVMLLLGWIGACALAEVIDQRKAICAWLKQ